MGSYAYAANKNGKKIKSYDITVKESVKQANIWDLYIKNFKYSDDYKILQFVQDNAIMIQDEKSNIKIIPFDMYTPDLAKGKEKELTVTFFMGGKQIDKLTAEQKERMMQRISKTMSIYYSAHMDEYLKI